MTAPRTYAVSRTSRIGARIGVAVLGSLAAAGIAAGLLAEFGADASFMRPMFLFFGAVFGGIAVLAARSASAAEVKYQLRADGIEFVPAEGMPEFIGWNQITGLRLTRLNGRFELIGPGDQVLLKISNQIEGLGELLNTILAQAVLPKRRVALPYETEKKYPAMAIVLFAFVLLMVTVPAFVIYQDSGSLAGLILPAILLVVAVVERIATPRSIVIDRPGITIRRVVGDKFLAWEVLEGGALAVLRGPKGSIAVGAVVRRRDGTWQGLRLDGTDPVDLLAAIAASGPGRIIAAPDRLMLAGPSAFGATYREPRKISFLKK
jgi:hypothetical protein